MPHGLLGNLDVWQWKGNGLREEGGGPALYLSLLISPGQLDAPCLVLSNARVPVGLSTPRAALPGGVTPDGADTRWGYA